MTPERLQSILTQTRQGLERLYGERLAGLVLYGSQARGDARPDSDIDLLILLQDPFDRSEERDRISMFVANLCLHYTIVISCTFATIQKYREYESGFFRNIRREGISV